MKTELANRIKELRTRKGFSQEELSEKTGLSLRTIQRIENGETEPRGDSLKRLAQAFDVTSDDLVDWTVQEDRGFLLSLNLSSLSFLPFPLLGILVPLIIWISKKGKIQNVDRLAKEILLGKVRKYSARHKRGLQFLRLFLLGQHRKHAVDPLANLRVREVFLQLFE